MKHIKKIATQIGGIIISRLNRNERKVFLQDGSGEGMDCSKSELDKALGFDVFELEVKDIKPSHVAAVHKFYQEEF